MKQGRTDRDWAIVAVMTFCAGAVFTWALISDPSVAARSKDIEWPAWVQAVGSVMAIVVAILVPRNSDRRREQREADKEERENASQSAKEQREIADRTAKEEQDRLREIAIARSHSVNLIRELAVVSETMSNLETKMSDWNGNHIQRLSTAHWTNPPDGGGAYRDREPADQIVVSSYASTLHSIIPAIEVPIGLRENAPKLALMPEIGDKLLDLIVSLDLLQEETRIRWKEFAEDTFKSDPTQPLKKSMRKIKTKSDGSRADLLKLFPDASGTD